MKIWRLHFRKPDGESTGYSFHATRHDALTVKHQNEIPVPDCRGSVVTMDCFNVSVTKVGMLAALRRYASHADNG